MKRMLEKEGLFHSCEMYYYVYWTFVRMSERRCGVPFLSNRDQVIDIVRRIYAWILSFVVLLRRRSYLSELALNRLIFSKRKN